MSVPPTIARLVSQAGALGLPGLLAVADSACEAAKHHSPRPLLVRAYRVSVEGVNPIDIDQDEPGAVTMCGTCADNVEVAVALFASHGGVLPWQARREFGNLVRAIAQRPFEETAA